MTTYQFHGNPNGNLIASLGDNGFDIDTSPNNYFVCEGGNTWAAFNLSGSPSGAWGGVVTTIGGGIVGSYYTSQSAINGEIQMQDLISLTDDATPPTGIVNTEILNQIINNASGEIDQACANIYGQQLPFNPVPRSVANMALTISCYRLYRRRETPDEMNKWYQQYQRVRDFLDKVNTGELHLDDVPGRDFPQGALTSQCLVYSGGPFSTSSGFLSNTM